MTDKVVLGTSESGPIDGMLVATRIHFKNELECELDIEKVRNFVRYASMYARCIVFAIESREGVMEKLSEECVALEREREIRIHCFPVSPWGSFSLALNAIVNFAAKNLWGLICFQSLEVTPNSDIALCLVDEIMKDINNTLVVGAAFPGQHDFMPGRHLINGCTVPWNTFAVWNTRKICITGFTLISEGLPPCNELTRFNFTDQNIAIPAGIEEVCTISVLQKLQPDRCIAKLVLHPSTANSWNMNFTDEARKEWHKTKMSSKLERSQRQLDFVGIGPGHVIHIEYK